MIRVNSLTIDSYYNYILSNPIEVERFAESFNINYSYFFRNWDVFKRFQAMLLECVGSKQKFFISDLEPNPSNRFNVKLKPKKKTQKIASVISNFPNGKKFLTRSSLYRKINSGSIEPLRIWSCPCASGEEPYSIAMILDNLKIQIPHFPNFEIIASDIDKTAIKNAKMGLYNEYSIKDISEYFEKNYFNKKRDRLGYKYSIINNIRTKIEFINEDVTNGHLKTWKYDVIFCRNLLIYLNRNNRDKFLNMIDYQMKKGGLLILGKTETLLNTKGNFRLADSRNHIYIKT